MSTEQPRRCTLEEYGGTYTANHTMLSPSGKVSGRARGQAMNRESEKVQRAGERAEEYYAEVRAGRIINPNDPHRRTIMIHREIKDFEDKIESAESKIKFYESIGMGKRGKIKPSYKRVIDEFAEDISVYKKTIEQLREELGFACHD